MPDRTPQPPGVPPTEAMKKLADMIRRAETGRRIRLTRRGKLSAFIVPPDDVQRLEWLEEQERLYRESQEGGGGDQYGMSDYDEPAFAEPPALEPEPDVTAARRIDFDDFRQRAQAIAAFRKNFDRVIGASETLGRAEISRRLKDDGYIASAILSIIGEG